MTNTGEFQKLPEEQSSVRQELTDIFEFFKTENFDLPEHARQELIALCELMQETPSEEDSMKLSLRDFSIFFTDQDGSETVEIIRNVRSTLEYATEQQRPGLIQEYETKIADYLTSDRKVSLSLLTLLGIVSQYRTDSKTTLRLLELFNQLDVPYSIPDKIPVEFLRTTNQSDKKYKKQIFSPIQALSPEARVSLATLFRINRPYTNLLSHTIFDFFEHHYWALLQMKKLPEDLRIGFADAFRQGASIMNGENYNFLIFMRFVQIVRLFEGANFGTGEAMNVPSYLHYLFGHLPEDLKSCLLIGKQRDADSIDLNEVGSRQNRTVRREYREDTNYYDFSGGDYETLDKATNKKIAKNIDFTLAYFHLAPHYIAEYRAGNMTAIFYVTDEEYEILDRAMADASAKNSPKIRRRLQSLENDAQRAGIQGSINLKNTFFDPEKYPALYRCFDSVGKMQIRNNNEDILLRNGFHTQPHQPLSKDIFFKALFPGEVSFNNAQYNEYIHLMRPPMRESIEDYLTITLADKPLWAPRNFLNFLSLTGMSYVDPIKGMIGNYGDGALISFLATEGDREFGNTLVGIGTQFGKAASPLFQKYAAIAQTAYRAGDYLRDNFGQGAEAEPIVRAFTQNLLARGKELLRSAAVKKDQKELLEELEIIDEQTSMVCAGVAAQKGKRLDPEDVKPISWNDFTSEEMRAHPEITRLVRAGYEKNLRREWGDNAKVERLLAELDSRVNDPENKSRFYVILRADKTPDPLIGSTVFTDTGKGEKYWSALFFETAYKGSGFYPSIIIQALEKESEDAKISGKTSALKDIATSYIEQAQFEGVRFYHDEQENDGVLIIERPIKKRVKPEFPSPPPSFSAGDVSDRITAKKPLIAFQADTRDLFDAQMIQEIFSPLSHGYVLSRYTKDAEHAQLVFEYRG